MPTCGRCHAEKEPAAFNKKARAKSGLQPTCRECNSAYLKRHYAANKAGYLRRARVSDDRVVEIVRAAKSKPCADCGGTFHFAAMDFDHRPGASKSFGLAACRRSGSNAALAEIEKCDVVCANCHRVRSWARQQPR